jgi:molybdenum cofactor cytidylyltransferase
VKPALVILAAGASTRLGQCKALARIGARCVLERLRDEGACFDARAPLVVTGADHAAISAANIAGIELAWNEGWSSGRTSSAQLAAAKLSGLDLCFAPVDVPLVPRVVFERLLEAWIEAGSPPGGWLAPRCAQRFGHPIVVGRTLLEELAGFEPGMPLSALRARAAVLFSVDVESSAVLDDLDTPGDLARLRSGTST